MDIQEFVTKNTIFETPSTIMEWIREDRQKYKNKIVKAYLPLAYSLSTKVMRSTGKQFDETFSDALYGLSYAIDKFNPDYGDSDLQFFEFARVSMNRRIWDGQRDAYMIKPPATETLRRGTQRITHTNTFSSMINDNETYTFEEKLEGTLYDDNEEMVDNEQKLIELINETKNISGKTKNVIVKYLRLGEDTRDENGDRYTFNHLALQYGVTKQRISQQFNEGIEKLKKNEEFKTKLKKFYEN